MDSYASEQYGFARGIEKALSRHEIAWTRSDLQEVFRSYEIAAELGHVSAMLRVGYILTKVSSYKRQLDDAANTMMSQDDITEINQTIGLCRRVGLDRPLDGIAWLNRAAELGSSNALYALSEVYRLGLGVPADSAMAANLAEQATAAQRASEAAREARVEGRAFSASGGIVP